MSEEICIEFERKNDIYHVLEAGNALATSIRDEEEWMPGDVISVKLKRNSVSVCGEPKDFEKLVEGINALGRITIKDTPFERAREKVVRNIKKQMKLR